MSFEVALFACFGVSIDVFPGFSYSYSALAVLVLVLEDKASSTILDVSSINVKSIPNEKVYRHGCLYSSTSTTKSDALP